jgi:DNA end-binding protein Ku
MQRNALITANIFLLQFSHTCFSDAKKKATVLSWTLITPRVTYIISGAQLEVMAARSMWKGSISFGLVNIPVKVYLATEDREFSFNQLCPNGHRIQYKRWCPVEEKEIGFNEIKKGYEVSKNSYIAIEKKDIDNIKLKTTNTIDVKEFVEAKDFDPILIERSYYVAPDTKRGAVDKAYSLLARVLSETNKIAVGKVVFKDKEHVVALRAYQRGIIMHMLHYLDEVRPVNEIEGMANIQKTGIGNKEEISLGKMLVQNLSTKHFDMSKYSDSYAQELKNLIDAKVKGKTYAKSVPVEKESPKDLVAALKASLQKTKARQ